jgi:hypothetical protein
MIEKVVRKSRIEDVPSDFSYWQQQSFEQRLSTLEAIRREFHGWQDDSQPRLQRVCRVVKRE